jgi:hypothetical protein
VDASQAFRAAQLIPKAQKILQTTKADARTRTADPFITSEVLYQLSYVGGAAQV